MAYTAFVNYNSGELRLPHNQGTQPTMRHAYSVILLAIGAFTMLSGHLISDLMGYSAPVDDTSHLVIGFLITLFGVFVMIASLVVWEKYPRK